MTAVKGIHPERAHWTVDGHPKRTYATKSGAKHAARTVQGGGRPNVYRCPDCGWWHLGNWRRHA